MRGIKGVKTFLELLPHWGRLGVNWVMGRPLYVDVDGVLFQYNGGGLYVWVLARADKA